MCQSKEQGGRRCNAHGSYFSANTLDAKMLDEDKNQVINPPTNSAEALHLISYAAEGTKISEDILQKARNYDLSTLSPKQHWVTWKKLALSDNPSQGLKLLHKLGYEPYYKELHNVRNVPQSPYWHPEGTVEKHLQESADKAAYYAKEDKLNKKETEIAVLGAMVHDLGKATHTQIREDKITSYSHDTAGEPLAKSFLSKIGAPPEAKKIIPTLVKLHMCHARTNVTMKSFKKILNQLEDSDANINQLIRVMNADIGGRGTASEERCDDFWKAKMKEYKQYEKQQKTNKKDHFITSDDFLKEGYTHQQLSDVFKEVKEAKTQNPNISKQELVEHIKNKIPYERK